MFHERIFMIDEMTYLGFGKFIENIKEKYSDERVIGYRVERKLNKEGKIEAFVTFAKEDKE